MFLRKAALIMSSSKLPVVGCEFETKGIPCLTILIRGIEAANVYHDTIRIARTGFDAVPVIIEVPTSATSTARLAPIEHTVIDTSLLPTSYVTAVRAVHQLATTIAHACKHVSHSTMS